MTENVKNIYCIGRNYVQHAKELNNAVPQSPLLFTKPTHSLVGADGQEIILPGHLGELQYEVEVVIHVARQYEAGIKPEDLIDRMTIGRDFTLRDLQNELKSKGYPWLLCKGFLNSAVISSWIPFEGLEAVLEKEFFLLKNGIEVQKGSIKDMIFDIPSIMEYTAKHLGLGQGDIIFTGTPAGVGPAANGDHFVCRWEDKELGSCIITLSA